MNERDDTFKNFKWYVKTVRKRQNSYNITKIWVNIQTKKEKKRYVFWFYW